SDKSEVTKTKTEKKDEGLREGLHDMDEAVDKLNSRLRQSMKSVYEVSNSYLVDYYELIKPLTEDVLQTIAKIDDVFKNYSKVDNTVNTYPSTWNKEKKKIDRKST